MITEKIDETTRVMKIAMRVAAWRLAAAAAMAGAIIMLSAALFIWLLEQFDAVMASILVACVFIALGVAFLLMAYAIHKNRETTNQQPKAHMEEPWVVNPAVVTAGLQAARIIGGRRAASIAAGALTILWIMNRIGRAPHDRRMPD